MASMAHVLLVTLVAMLLVGTCQGRPLPQPAASPAQGMVVNGITAIYNFGDSISDTGNLSREGAVGMTQHTTELC